MEILWTIIIGFIAGVIAKIIMPGQQKMGFILTTILGITGAVVGSYLPFIKNFKLLGAVVGALLILFIYGIITKKKS